MIRLILVLGLIFFYLGCVGINKAKLKSLGMVSPVRARIVLDPGHGGRDSGAVGQHGLKEKDLTLDIARRIKKLMGRIMPNVLIKLTRSSDKYVGLEERVQVANKFKGDVFISLHINSSEKKLARGFEVYSLDVASDRHSERLAARENNNIDNKNKKKLNFILSDLMAHSHRSESDLIAKILARGLKSQMARYLDKKNINNRGYNQAIFHVLFVNMPSVLTELFFISNPEEERLLMRGAFRELVARGIVLGLKYYLEKKILRAKT